MKISVAICTYNGEKYIKDQLDSIISQTLVPDEIIVGDDCSTDATLEIVEKALSRSCIKFNIIKNKENIGVNANFQNAIKHCTGDIIFTSDQDDVWIPTKIETIVSCFEKEPKDVLVFSNGYVTDENLNISADMWSGFQFTKDKQRKFLKHKYYDVLFSKNYIAGSAMAFKRDFIINFLNNPFMTFHDYWIALHAPLYGDIGMIDVPLIYYRQHGNNVIGIHSNKLMDKIKRWTGKLKNALDDSEERMVMSQSFYEENQILLQKSNYKTIALHWVQFNYWRYSLKEMNRIKAVLTVLMHILTGKYKCFYSRSFAGLQDLISCCIL